MQPFKYTHLAPSTSISCSHFIHFCSAPSPDGTRMSRGKPGRMANATWGLLDCPGAKSFKTHLWLRGDTKWHSVRHFLHKTHRLNGKTHIPGQNMTNFCVGCVSKTSNPVAVQVKSSISFTESPGILSFPWKHRRIWLESCYGFT